MTEQDKNYLFILSYFIKGHEPSFESLEKAGELVGNLHRIMRDYPGKLIVHDKLHFVDRYISILKKIQYPKWKEFETLGNEMWDKVKNIPRGYCHRDLYGENVHTTDSGEMYIIDFDTSCLAFPGYDVILFCNRTHYFEYDYDGYEKTRVRLECFLPGYLRYNSMSNEEISTFHVMIGLYHYPLITQFEKKDIVIPIQKTF